MKILHTADWHLGKRLENVLRLDEQEQVLAEICAIADTENVDAVLIAGDLFDTFNPSSDAVDLFYRTLKTLSNNGKRLVVAIAGNHDSPERIEAPNPLAKECGIVLLGFPHSTVSPFELDSGLKIMRSVPGFIEVKLPNQSIPLRLILTPYVNEFRLKTFLGTENAEQEMRDVVQEFWQQLADSYCDNSGVNLLVTHLFMVKNGGEIPPEPEEEKAINHVGGAQAIYTSNVPKQLQYVALGHLHRPFTMDNSPCPVVYSGSPLCYSFSEAHQEKRVVLLDAFPNEPVQMTIIPLKSGKPLLRHRAKNCDEAVEWLKNNQHALIELTVETTTFLTAENRQQLNKAHNGIITLIPDLISEDLQPEERQKNIDLSQDIETLFKAYFLQQEKLPASEEILQLFREINALNVEK